VIQHGAQLRDCEVHRDDDAQQEDGLDHEGQQTQRRAGQLTRRRRRRKLSSNKRETQLQERTHRLSVETARRAQTHCKERGHGPHEHALLLLGQRCAHEAPAQ
jgi:hypothetical protein